MRRTAGSRASPSSSILSSLVTPVPHPYSERFFAVKGLTGTVSYLVPPKKRAIISNMTAYWNGTVGFDVFLRGTAAQTIVMFGGTVVDGPPLWFWWDGHQVFYAGELVSLFSGNEACDVTVSGYLLTDA